MLETMIESKARDLLKKEYPHIEHPMGVYARITKVSGNEYNLKILDESKAVDTRFPEIPKVESDKSFVLGDTVAAILLYGKLSHIFILGKVI